MFSVGKRCFTKQGCVLLWFLYQNYKYLWLNYIEALIQIQFIQIKYYIHPLWEIHHSIGCDLEKQKQQKLRKDIIKIENQHISSPKSSITPIQLNFAFIASPVSYNPNPT